MSKIRKVTQITNNRHLNYFAMEAVNKAGHVFDYYMASRASSVEGIMPSTGIARAAGVNICCVAEVDGQERIVLVNQFRFPLGARIYEFPAGLVEPGEDPVDAGVRELYEETGLRFEALPTPEGYHRPFFNSCGMTDEANATIFGRAIGTPTTEHLEATEDLKVVLADREEVKRILREENVALNCAYMLMQFAASEEWKFFRFLEV